MRVQVLTPRQKSGRQEEEGDTAVWVRGLMGWPWEWAGSSLWQIQQGGNQAFLLHVTLDPGLSLQWGSLTGGLPRSHFFTLAS